MHKQEQQNVLYIWFYVNYVCVCVVLGSKQKKLKEKVEKMVEELFQCQENLPHERCSLVCSEDEVKNDCSKLNSDLVIAYQRGWTVVRPSFIEWAVKERIPPNVEEHAVDLTPLAALSTGTCGAMQQSVERLRFR